MTSQQHSAIVLLLTLFLIWLIFPETEYTSQSLALSDLAEARLKRYHHALDVLNQSHWGDFAPAPKDGADAGAKYLNLTGFRQKDGFAWEDLERFREKSLQLSHHAIPPVGGKYLWDVGEGEAVWANASGTVHGEWVRREGSVKRGYASYNLNQSVPTMDWIGDKVEWARNMTGDSGRILLRISSNRTVTEYTQLSPDNAPLGGGSVRKVKATAVIEDLEGSGQNWEMRLWGVHWPRQGVLILTTTSEKFEGLFGLPHLTPSADFFQSSQMLLNQTISNKLAEKEQHLYVDLMVPWSSDLENPMLTSTPLPHCEFIIYAQVHPPGRQSLHLNPDIAKGDSAASIIEAIEAELHSPQGAPIPNIPDLQMSTVVYSPDCAFFLESKGPPNFPVSEADHLKGRKTEVHTNQVNHWILVLAAVVFVQVHLLKNQMKESCTPSTMGRVSFWTIAAMVMVDGMTFTAAATWVSSATVTFLPTMSLLFSAFLSMIIGGSFLSRIYEVQLPEARPRRDQSPNAVGNTPSSTPTTSSTPNPTGQSSGSLLPAPVTARQPDPPPSQPIIIPSDQDIDAEIASQNAAPPNVVPRIAPQPQTFQSIIGRLILFSICLIFLVISSTTWYPSVRSLFLNVCAFTYLSLWLPQIFRNILRNCRRALTWPFVLGQSCLRILPIAYFWLKQDNFLYARTDTSAFLVFCVYMWLQLFILGAQDVLGPRFGIPSGWTPEAWDYHPLLREDNLEAGGLPIGLVADDTPGIERARSDDDKTKKRSATRVIDCAICREVLEVPVLTAEDEDTGVAGVFARRLYMVTPCRHIFHTTCLEGWMRFRLQCPICREELPPL